MSFLIVQRERYLLQLGETVLGGDSDEILATSALLRLPPFAVVRCDLDEGATIRALPSGPAISVEGEPLGATPRPLRHGDSVTVAGLEILYGDARAAGATSHTIGIPDERASLLAGLVRPEGTAASGGRLTALANGTVYEIPATGLEIGRDPECAIALHSRSVSRRHAVITPGLLGYTIVDRSANGVRVNGVRIEGSCLLGQGDLIRIGGEEFRFEADPANLEPAPPLPRESSSASGPAARSAPSAASRGSATSRTAGPTEKAPARSRPSAHSPSLLATLEVLNTGPDQGLRFRIEQPLVQIGRSAQSDVRLEEASVSSTHATLMQRGTVWHLRDIGSRNGTYVDGEAIDGERELRGVAELRFGNVKLLFRPIARGDSEAAETRSIVGAVAAKSDKKGM